MLRRDGRCSSCPRAHSLRVQPAPQYSGVLRVAGQHSSRKLEPLQCRPRLLTRRCLRARPWSTCLCCRRRPWCRRSGHRGPPRRCRGGASRRAARASAARAWAAEAAAQLRPWRSQHLTAHQSAAPRVPMFSHSLLIALILQRATGSATRARAPQVVGPTLSGELRWRAAESVVV